MQISLCFSNCLAVHSDEENEELETNQNNRHFGKLNILESEGNNLWKNSEETEVDIPENS
jgi:hypothetical protein